MQHREYNCHVECCNQQFGNKVVFDNVRVTKTLLLQSNVQIF